MHNSFFAKLNYDSVHFPETIAKFWKLIFLIFLGSKVNLKENKFEYPSPNRGKQFSWEKIHNGVLESQISIRLKIYISIYGHISTPEIFKISFEENTLKLILMKLKFK